MMKSIIPRLFVILPMLFFVSTLFAQTENSSIKGKVLGTNNNPLTDVNVQLRGTKKTTTTNQNGEYELKEIPTGTYTLVFSSVGIEAKEVTVVMKPGETTVVPQISLKQTTDVLQTVEVTGRKQSSYKNDNSFSSTKTEMAVKDIPQSISFVTKELIQDRQALRLKDIVQNVAGINEFSTYDDITMRGFRNSGSNGRLLNGLRSFNNFWTSPLLVNIEKVEFIKGPASAVFSNTNPGGTINMVTKKPLDEARQAISFTTGSYNTFRTQADFTGPLNDDKTILYRLNVGYENAETFRDQVANKSVVIAPSISFLPKDGTRLNADLVYSNLNTILDRGRTIIQGTKDLFATPINLNLAQPGDFLKQQNLALTLSFSQKINDNIAFNASYLKMRFDERLNEHVVGAYITPDSVRMNFTDRINKFNGNNLSSYLSFKFNKTALQQTVVSGYDYIDGYQLTNNRFARTTANGVANQSLVRLVHNIQPVASYTYNAANIYSTGSKYNTQGVYLQDVIKYKKIQLLVSLRQEFYKYPPTPEFTFASAVVKAEQKQNALLPRVGLTYEISRNINIYTTYATGFEPQAGGTLGSSNAGGPFDPLTSSLYEAGAKGEFLNKRLFIGTAIYQITQNNVLVSANDLSRPDLLRQRGQERARGVELEATGRLAPGLSISVNYAYNDAIITEDVEGNINKLVGLTKENAPKNVSGSWIKYSLKKGKLNGLGFGLGHSQVSKRETFDRTLQLPSYVIFNSAVYYQVQRFQIGLNLNNVTDKQYLSGGYDYSRNFPGAPRNFLVNVGYTF